MLTSDRTLGQKQTPHCRDKLKLIQHSENLYE
jgi:hypothetical protein